MVQSDSVIIEQIRRGENRLYAVLVDRYKDQALTLAVRLLGDRADAEEVLQDAFLRAYRSLEQFRGDAKFSTWLYRIVYNACLTRLDRRRPNPQSLDAGEGLFESRLKDTETPSPIEELEASELRHAVREVLADLPEKYRAALTLFYLEEMSYEETAAILEQPVGTVKTLLFRGRNILRDRLTTRMQGMLI